MRVRDVSVRVEHVRVMPHGAKLLIDEPPGEALVVWALASLTDQDVADAIDRYLLHGRPLSDRWIGEGSLFAS